MTSYTLNGETKLVFWSLSVSLESYHIPYSYTVPVVPTPLLIAVFSLSVVPLALSIAFVPSCPRNVLPASRSLSSNGLLPMITRRPRPWRLWRPPPRLQTPTLISTWHQRRKWTMTSVLLFVPSMPAKLQCTTYFGVRAWKTGLIIHHYLKVYVFFSACCAY